MIVSEPGMQKHFTVLGIINKSCLFRSRNEKLSGMSQISFPQTNSQSFAINIDNFFYFTIKHTIIKLAFRISTLLFATFKAQVSRFGLPVQVEVAALAAQPGQQLPAPGPGVPVARLPGRRQLVAVAARGHVSQPRRVSPPRQQPLEAAGLLQLLLRPAANQRRAPRRGDQSPLT